jgi:hypothetical protein
MGLGAVRRCCVFSSGRNWSCLGGKERSLKGDSGSVLKFRIGYVAVIEGWFIAVVFRVRYCGLTR